MIRAWPILELKRDCPAVKIIVMSGGGTAGTMNYLPAARQLGAIRGFAKLFNCLDVVRAVGDLLGPDGRAAPAYRPSTSRKVPSCSAHFAVIVFPPVRAAVPS